MGGSPPRTSASIAIRRESAEGRSVRHGRREEVPEDRRGLHSCCGPCWRRGVWGSERSGRRRGDDLGEAISRAACLRDVTFGGSRRINKGMLAQTLARLR